MNFIDTYKKNKLDKRLTDIEYVKSLKPDDLEKVVFAKKKLIDYIFEQHQEIEKIKPKYRSITREFESNYFKRI